MAELLIKALEPWNNDHDPIKMSEDDLKKFKRRLRKGDIIVVRPDGWPWGKEECLPNFVVVKTPESYEGAKKYEQNLTDISIQENPIPLKSRKYHLTVKEVDEHAALVQDTDEIIPVELKAEIKAKMS